MNSEEIIKLNLDDELVKEADSTIPKFMGYVYDIKLDGSSKTVEELDDETKLGFVAAYYSSKLNLNSVPKEEYNGTASKIYKEEDFNKLFEDTSFVKCLDNLKDKTLSFRYNSITKEDEGYKITLYATGFGSESFESDYLNLLEAKRIGNKLILTYGYAYIKEEFDQKENNFVTTYYMDNEKVIEVIELLSNKKDLVDWNRFDKYEFVFDITNNNIRIQKINLVTID